MVEKVFFQKFARVEKIERFDKDFLTVTFSLKDFPRSPSSQIGDRDKEGENLTLLLNRGYAESLTVLQGFWVKFEAC